MEFITEPILDQIHHLVMCSETKREVARVVEHSKGNYEIYYCVILGWHKDQGLTKIWPSLGGAVRYLRLYINNNAIDMEKEIARATKR